MYTIHTTSFGDIECRTLADVERLTSPDAGIVVTHIREVRVDALARQRREAK